MPVILNRVGERYSSNHTGEFEIIEYFSARNCTIKFSDGTVMKNIRYDEIKNGRIRNPNAYVIFGVACIGEGVYKSNFDGGFNRYYVRWRNMLQRCYNPKIQNKNPSYKGVIVCDEWLNFQNFAKWYEENYINGFHLDKDIICPDCKVYSPETCAFVPREINNLFTKSNKARGKYPIGVCRNGNNYAAVLGNPCIYIGTFKTPEEAFQAYKIAKESHIRELASKWKDQIDPRVYEAMMNYEVKITD